MNRINNVYNETTMPITNSDKESKGDWSKKVAAIIVAVIGFLLVIFSLYISTSTCLLSIGIENRVQPCSLSVLPADPGRTKELPDAKIAGNITTAITNYLDKLRQSYIINFTIAAYLFALLVTFLALRDHGLMVVRSDIKTFAVIGANVFTFLQVCLICLAVLIIQSGDIIINGDQTVLKLRFKIDTGTDNSYCPLDNGINNYWNQGLLIAGPVLTFITVGMIAVLVYLKLSTASISRLLAGAPTVVVMENGAWS